ncbi:MAG: YihY/virulence factor BrkB family protein [Phycisphaerae bacterium]
MARFRDIPYAVKHVGIFTLFKRLISQVMSNYLTVWAAALAYSWLFALFPFLIFIVAVLPLLPDQARAAVQRQISQTVDNVIPATTAAERDLEGSTFGPPDPRPGRNADRSDTDAAEEAVSETETQKKQQLQQVGQTVKTVVDDILETEQSGVLSVAILVAVWVASGGMSMTMSGLDRAYGVLDPRPFYKQRLVAIALTIVAGILVILVLILLPIGTLILNALDWVGGFDFIAGWARIVIDLARNIVALVLIAMIISLIYWAGTSVRTRYRVLTPGAAFAVVSWLLLGYGFRLYIEQFQGARSYVATYGAIAGVAIMLLLFYLFAMTLMIGAAINAELSFARLGIRPGQKPPPDVEKDEELDEDDRALAEHLREQTTEQAQAATSLPVDPDEKIKEAEEENRQP